MRVPHIATAVPFFGRYAVYDDEVESNLKCLADSVAESVLEERSRGMTTNEERRGCNAVDNIFKTIADEQKLYGEFYGFGVGNNLAERLENQFKSNSELTCRSSRFTGLFREMTEDRVDYVVADHDCGELTENHWVERLDETAESFVVDEMETVVEITTEQEFDNDVDDVLVEGPTHAVGSVKGKRLNFFVKQT